MKGLINRRQQRILICNAGNDIYFQTGNTGATAGWMKKYKIFFILIVFPFKLKFRLFEF
jgi:hypothetical protein